MRNIIVGTAGHIDHGKTALVKALTGIDGDRLTEEKRRGITIDLGFAHLQLTRDIRLGFIDVPGHERFVRNMLAGAAGIDMVLLVIAADESIKPQTREHFEICRMLGVEAGVIALTKADLAHPDLLDLTRLEVDEFVAGSFLENAPKVAVSSVTSAGLPELRQALETCARAVREKSAGGWFRLPIDRAFTMKGFGTVVTGTLVSGTLKREQEVELYPAGRRLRVRGLQVYGEGTERARAGERTAVNLPDIEAAEIERGMVLSEAARFVPSRRFDCRFDLLTSARPLKNGAPVHLHIGSAEIEAEVRLLDKRANDKRAKLQPGESTWARIGMREPALVLPGDRFIIRMFSPVVTIGGGIVVDITCRKYDAARLQALLEGDARARVELLAAEQPHGIEESRLIAITGFRDLPKTPAIEATGKWLIGAARTADLRRQVTAAVRQFHRDHSLLAGIQKQDLKGRAMPRTAVEIFDHILGTSPELVQDGEVVRLKSHRVVLKQDEQQARMAIDTAFERAGLTAPAVQEVLGSSGLEESRARSVLQILVREGRLVKISNELVLHTSAVAGLREILRERSGERFTVPAFKEWTGVSRKYAIPLLEYLDRTHVTRREGDQRVVIGA
jgi:selenocysteine-specific elongation factor